MVTTSVAPSLAAGPLVELEADRAQLGRTSTAERVAEVLRIRITEGFFRPGTRLSEEAIGSALGVSRNTLREAFRLLAHERLVVHKINRGVFVRVLSVDDVIDLYRVRRIVEGAGVRSLDRRRPGVLDSVHAAVATGEQAAAAGDWRAAGTADLRFHRALAGLAGSARLDELMHGLLAELRLAFHVVVEPRLLHAPYIPRNRQLCRLLERGDVTAANRELMSYLDDAQQQLLDAYRDREQTG